MARTFRGDGNKNNIVLAQNRVLTNGIELRIQIEVHATTVNWGFYKDAKNIYRREGRNYLRVVLGTGSTGKRMKLAPYPPARTKLKSRWIKEPSRCLMPGQCWRKRRRLCLSFQAWVRTLWVRLIAQERPTSDIYDLIRPNSFWRTVKRGIAAHTAGENLQQQLSVKRRLESILHQKFNKLNIKKTNDI